MFSRRLVVPGKVFVANRRNGITKPFNGNSNMSTKSLFRLKEEPKSITNSSLREPSQDYVLFV